MAADPSKLLLAFVDGCVGVFSLSQRKIVYCTEAGHSETIYDCRFSPASPDVLATASYDGTIKLWDILTQRCTLELRNRENPSALYSLAWGKGEDGSKLLASSSSGCIFMWDTITGALVQTFRHHQKPVFKVSWRGDKIASSSSDCTCVVFDSSGSILHKFAHPNAVYGCDWNPFNPNLLATGCHDGIIRVFDVSQQIMTPIVKLEAHDARVFNVIWSPLVPGILASGSDDSTVRVWEVGDSTNDSKLLNTLEGHENNVRGLLWNPEVPWLLLSGSWDGTIKLWDTRKPTECIQTVYSHLADVYGLDVHPERPFSIVSSSRDTSLRFWSLDSELFSRIKLQIILQGGKPDPMHTADAATGMLEDSPITMCGQAGHAMAKALQGINEDELQAYTKLFNFASSAPGMREFWSLVYSIDKEAASGLENSRYNLVHVNDLRALYKAKAEALQKKRFSIGNGRAADRLQEAALIHLKLGNVKEYCEIMRSIGEWERAIAVAPAVSPAYWQQLCRQRANELAAQGDDKALPYLMATGDVNHLTDFFGNDFQSALLVASGEATDKLPRPQEEEDAEAPAAEEARDDVFITDRIKHLTEQTAKQMLLRGKPIIAACYFLSIGDGMGAIKCLLQGNEVILALALCRVLKEDVDDVFRAAAAVSESLGMWHEALSFLQLLNDPTNELMLLLARFTGSTTETQDLYNKVGLQTQEGFQEQGEQQQKEGKTLDAVRSFMAARNFGAAADLGLGQIKDALGKADKVPPDMKELAEVAHVLNSADTGSVRAEILPEILIFSYYFGMRKAMDLGYYPVVPFLVKSIMFLCEKHGITPAFPISQLRIAEAQCCQLSDPKLALEIANELAEAKDTPANVKATAQALQRALGDPAAVAAAADPKKGGGAATPSEPIVVPARSRLILPPGCTLPSGNPDKFPVNSLLTGASIQVGFLSIVLARVTAFHHSRFYRSPFQSVHTHALCFCFWEKGKRKGELSLNAATHFFNYRWGRTYYLMIRRHIWKRRNI